MYQKSVIFVTEFYFIFRKSTREDNEIFFSLSEFGFGSNVRKSRTLKDMG